MQGEKGLTLVPRYGSHRDVIGLPANAVVVTNSERESASCDLRWFYGYGLGRRSNRISVPLSFGDAGHMALADAWGWWAQTDRPYNPLHLEMCAWCVGDLADPSRPDCPACGSTGLGPIPRAVAKWELAAAESAARYGAADEDEEEDIPHRAERLRRALDGYFRVNGLVPPGGMRVVGVEIPVARQILGPNGKPYRPEVPIFRMPDGGLRLARPGDDPNRVFAEKRPFFYVGIVDALLADRNTGTLYVGEHKWSTAPETFLNGLTNDPQTATYCWILDGVLDELPLPRDVQDAIDAHGGVRKVGGYLYMVNASSMQYDPEPLKAGGLSVAKNRTVPSWRFEAALAAAQAANPRHPKLQTADYQDHIADLRTRIDPRLYRREAGTVGPIERARFGSEAYAIAVRFAQSRRDAWRVALGDLSVAAAFPRTPVCRIAGGSCSFRGPCASASLPDVGPTGSFVEADVQVWYPDGRPNPLPLPAAPAQPTSKEKSPCSF